MTTVDAFSSTHLAALAATGSDNGRVLIILVAIGILLLTARSMMRAVVPVVEVLKAALAAMTSFVLIAAAVVVLFLAVLPR
ncbi:hypothetical protein [Actinoplanes sp. URMC 104]|uniref:hypothetical protein n=1 Tax=Actinoplanes sp. URMC 104 TaxID=3423409 RepID=UPI003F1D8211